ncbi:hypothetical protein [Mesorhizobium sp.]|uniref:hypothetical protein n=1 Tax=Mesorhizobium sp. TaxID=1871066 RepID=UPI0025EEB40D|nr:hypothetical protein [Mesorhizobium sp.]
MAAIGSIDPLDTALVETEHSILAALPLKIGKQIVPGPEEFATVVAKDPVVRTGVGRNPQPYRQAIRALQLVVEILLGHGRTSLAPVCQIGKSVELVRMYGDGALRLLLRSGNNERASFGGRILKADEKRSED